MNAKFVEFVEKLKPIVEAEGVTYSEIADRPDLDECSVTITFFQSQEETVDRIIRSARKSLLRHNSMDFKAWGDDGYTFEVYKSFVNSHDYWSLTFLFADRYKLVEAFQA